MHNQLAEVADRVELVWKRPKDLARAILEVQMFQYQQEGQEHLQQVQEHLQQDQEPQQQDQELRRQDQQHLRSRVDRQSK